MAENMLPIQEQAKFFVRVWLKRHLDKTDDVKLKDDDVYVVWFCKTLQNWKALVSTTLPDGMYYEVTHNGNAHVTYLDAYKKFDNVIFPEEEGRVRAPAARRSGRPENPVP